MKHLAVFLMIHVSLSLSAQVKINPTDSLPDKQKAYGVRLLPSVVPQFYGLALGLVGSDAICNLPYTKTTNGICIALMNQCYEHNGIQIGLINRSTKLKGLQVGLWNVNAKRKLPLINF